MSESSRRSLFIKLAVVGFLACMLGVVMYGRQYIAEAFAFDEAGMILVVLGGVFVALIHFVFLSCVRNLTTHDARRIIFWLYWIGAPLVVFVVNVIFEGGGPFDAAIRMVTLIPMLILGYFLGFRVLVVYSIPCCWISFLPLLGIYLLSSATGYSFCISGMAVAISSYWFPTHRRMKELWQPKPLPRLRHLSRAGFTLIELLIVVLMVAIFSMGVAQLTGAAQRAAERQQNWQLAVELAENEIALLRAKDALPAVGTHPVEPELATLYKFAGQAQVEIRPGPHPALREVRVSVRLRQNADARDVTLAVLLPAQTTGGAP